MKCLICGGEYVNLGVHAKHKHGLLADEYRLEFGLLMTQPLVDAELSEHLSRMARIGIAASPGRKADLARRCRENAALALGGKLDSRFTEASRAAIAKSNVRRNDDYIRKIAPGVKMILATQKTKLDVTRLLGVGAGAIGRAVGVGDSNADALAERSRRAAEAHHRQQQGRIAVLLAHYESSRSAAEACRRAGIGKTTYKRWVAAGLVPRKRRA